MIPGQSKGAFLDFNQAYRKAADFCAVQERCINEVQLKLRIWNIYKGFFAKIIDKLIDEGFIDERRFALSYAGGKFRINGWGKIKIAAGLKTRNISSHLIQEAISAIETDAYTEYLLTLLQKKLKQLGGDTPQNRQKAAYFAVSRGFEPALIALQLRTDKLFEQ